MPKTVEPSPKGGAKAIRVIAETSLKGYAIDVDAIEKRIDVQKEKLAESTADAVKKHLNKVAWSFIKRLRKIGADDSDKLANVLAGFDHAREVFKLDDLANLNERMQFDGSGSTQETTSEDTSPKAENDDEKDFRPRHLRQPGASAADEVQRLAQASGATPRADEDHLKNVGKGPSGKPN